MTEQSFFNLPPKQLLTLYPEIIQNSDQQYEAAIIIASKGTPGIAISHLLISSEELIKAMIIVLDAKGFKFRTVKGMDIFFRQHEIRFFIGSIIFSISLFGEDLFKWLSILKKDPSLATNFIKEVMSNEKSQELFLKWYMGRKFIKIREEIKWFSKAEVFRQNGFYVDMKGELVSPLKITIKEFNEAKARIDKVNKLTKYIIETFATIDPEMIDEVERLKKTFEKKKYYTLIASGLENIRKGRKSFFNELLINFFGPLSDRKERRSMKKFNEIIKKSRNHSNDNTL